MYLTGSEAENLALNKKNKVSVLIHFMKPKRQLKN